MTIVPQNIEKAKLWLPQGQLMDEEKIIFFIRRHWFVLLVKYLFMLILAIIPLIAGYLLALGFPELSDSEVVRAVAIVVGSIYYLFIWITLFTVFIDYYFDIWIVTTNRIIDIEQIGLFHYEVSEQGLEQVQDVSANVQGLFPTFLDFGDVLVQSAAHKNLFHFMQIPQPAVVAQKINELAAKFRAEHGDRNNP